MKHNRKIFVTLAGAIFALTALNCGHGEDNNQEPVADSPSHNNSVDSLTDGDSTSDDDGNTEADGVTDSDGKTDNDGVSDTDGKTDNDDVTDTDGKTDDDGVSDTDGKTDTEDLNCPDNTFGQDCQPVLCLNGTANTGLNGDGLCLECDDGWTDFGDKLCDVDKSIVAEPLFPAEYCGDLWCGPTRDPIINYNNGATTKWQAKYKCGDNTSVSSWPIDLDEDGSLDDLIVARACIEGEIDYNQYVAQDNIFGVSSCRIGVYFPLGYIYGVNITDWQGLCVAYQSDFALEVNINPGTNIQVGTHSVTLPKSSEAIMVQNIEWKQFQSFLIIMGSGTLEDLLMNTSSISFNLSDSTKTGSFKIFSVGRYGMCKDIETAGSGNN